MGGKVVTAFPPRVKPRSSNRPLSPRRGKASEGRLSIGGGEKREGERLERETDATQKGCAGGGERRGPWERGRKQWEASACSRDFVFFSPFVVTPLRSSLSLSLGVEGKRRQRRRRRSRRRATRLFLPSEKPAPCSATRTTRTSSPGRRRGGCIRCVCLLGEREERERETKEASAIESIETLHFSHALSLSLSPIQRLVPSKQVEYAMEAVKQGSAAVGLKVRLKRKREIPPPSLFLLPAWNRSRIVFLL